MSSKNSKTRSPLKDKPLRFPGQSLGEEREALVENAVGQPLMLVVFMACIAGLEWWRWFFDAKPNPVIYSAAAMLTLLYALFRIRRVLPRLKVLRQGMEGEQAVGQFLERLREHGYTVFHDIVGSGFNIDHVLIGPGGIFTVETKTWSKPTSGDAKIFYDGVTIKLGGLAPDRNPVVQALAQASWIRSLLSESTGRNMDVRPVVVFPGWYVEASSQAQAEVWVLEPKALPAFLVREPLRLAEEDRKLASFHLSRAIRLGERERSHIKAT